MIDKTVEKVMTQKSVIRKNLFCLACSIFLFISSAGAQTDLTITGPQANFPIAIPSLCDGGEAGDISRKIAEVISKDLSVSGLFRVINPSTFIASQGNCNSADKIAYSDWSVIGAEGLVQGKIEKSGTFQTKLVAELYLYDVLQKRAVIGKKYEAAEEDYVRLGHRFANEIIRYFTGEPGVFGTQIAYVSKIGRFSELFIVDMDGSNTRQITYDHGLIISPAWSPNGKELLYTSYLSRQPELYMRSVSGGDPRRLTQDSAVELGSKFTPDGTNIILSTLVRGSRNIALMDLRGRIIRSITNSAALDVSPSMSPDGQQVVYCSNRGGGPQIYVLSMNGGSDSRISFTGSNYCTSPSWSPAGDKIAFVCRQGGNQIFVVPVGTTQAIQTTFVGNNEDPSWSPDGRYLVFSSDFGGGARSIVAQPIAGGAPRQVTFSKSRDSQPAWSPLAN